MRALLDWCTGPDADVDAVDDEHAEEALWVESDIRFFVHAAKEGELDAAEIDLMKALNQDEENYQAQDLICTHPNWPSRWRWDDGTNQY